MSSSLSSKPQQSQQQPPSSSAKSALPTTSDFKSKTRKREVVTKYEPEVFRDSLLALIPEDCDIDTYVGVLEGAADKLDYKRYAEPLFEFFFIGGLVAPGGQIVDDGARLNPYSIFACDDSIAPIKQRVEILNKLIRRFKYLQRKLEETLAHLLQYINKFGDNSHKLSTAVGLLISTQTVGLGSLIDITKDHLVKDGASLEFLTGVFQTYIHEQNVDSLCQSLQKSGLDDRLLEFFPPKKRQEEYLARHFETEGLKAIVDFYKKKQASLVKAEIKQQLLELLQGENAQTTAVTFVKAQMTEHKWTESETVTFLWDAIFESVEWTNRPEQLESQIVKTLAVWPKTLEPFCKSPKTEITLLQHIQAMCYDDARYAKHFRTIVSNLYKLDVISEAAVLYWSEKGALGNKGKAMFIKQMEPFVEWLNQQEEESEED
ncbi:armadillo-type protein [Zopfochytrium polystomum]|nr:armadillo-type protein [Zopfochytrium polystomum]